VPQTDTILPNICLVAAPMLLHFFGHAVST
jgi:hypothetical protein